MTVLVSSDTDIYISPGLYGDCLPTVSTGGAADSFHGPGNFSSPVPSCSHTRAAANSGPGRAVEEATRRRRDSCHIDAMTIVKVT
ncbi:hypothetical protein GCM10010350_08110 [Streptomyces galilaeus]|nr:hypothetical protein GCM10010350_08110 [Streptomyces galilaeus]